LIGSLVATGKLALADVEAALPRADVEQMQEKITKAWRAMQRAYPNSRFGRSDDDFCFKRVRPALPALKAAVKEAFEALAVNNAHADIVSMAIWLDDHCPFPNTGAFRGCGATTLKYVAVRLRTAVTKLAAKDVPCSWTDLQAVARNFGDEKLMDEIATRGNLESLSFDSNSNSY
jgi:hypothetical protein